MKSILNSTPWYSSVCVSEILNMRKNEKYLNQDCMLEKGGRGGKQELSRDFTVLSNFFSTFVYRRDVLKPFYFKIQVHRCTKQYAGKF